MTRQSTLYFAFLATTFALSCAGSVVHTVPYNPAADLNPTGTYTPRGLFDRASGPVSLGDRQFFDTAAVVRAEGVVLTLSLTRLDDVFDLTVMLENTSQESVNLSASDFRLLTNGRSLARPLAAHEAANLFMSRVAGYHPLPPKYVATTTTSAQWDGSVRSTTTINQDPWDAMTSGIIRASIAQANGELTSIAAMLYRSGLAGTEQVPPQTRIIRDLFWMAQDGLPSTKGASTVDVLIGPLRKEVLFRSY